MPISNIKFSTTKIRMFKGASCIGSATGFFFRHNGHKYLATNRHVVVDDEDLNSPDSLSVKLHANRTDLTNNLVAAIPLWWTSRSPCFQAASVHLFRRSTWVRHYTTNSGVVLGGIGTLSTKSRPSSGSHHLRYSCLLGAAGQRINSYHGSSDSFSWVQCATDHSTLADLAERNFLS